MNANTTKIKNLLINLNAEFAANYGATIAYFVGASTVHVERNFSDEVCKVEVFRNHKSKSFFPHDKFEGLEAYMG